MKSSVLGARDHDGLQYHVVCDDGRIFTARIFQTGTTTVQWAWIYEDGEVRVVLDSEDGVSLSTTGPLAVEGDHFRVESDVDGSGRLEVGVEGPEGFVLEYGAGSQLAGTSSAAWEPQRHYWQPDLRSTVSFNGEQLRARCFLKRYTWEDNAPRYWVFRMLNGYADDQGFAVWSADGLFEDAKHGNFKVLGPGQELWSGDPSLTYHGDMKIHTEGPDRNLHVAMTSLGQAERIIRSGAMDTRVTHQPVAFTMTDSSHDETTGHGVYEYVCGTLG